MLFYILYPLLWLLAWLPLPILYVFADVLCPLLHYVVRYRVCTVRTNITKAFPEKDARERRRIERRFYHHLCNYIVETLWMLHATPLQIRRRINFDNLQVLYDAIAEGHDIIALFGHYCNWEWVCSIPLSMRADIQIGTIYKPLKNKNFDRFCIKLRSRFGTECIPRQRTLRVIAAHKQAQRPYVLAFIADQTPSVNNIHFWTQFLHQDTPFITGWEQIARRTNDTVVFLEMQRVRRGHYHCSIHRLAVQPATSKPFAATQCYAQMLEANIRLQPELWLWSHRRWKHHRNNHEVPTATLSPMD